MFQSTGFGKATVSVQWGSQASFLTFSQYSGCFLISFRMIPLHKFHPVTKLGIHLLAYELADINQKAQASRSEQLHLTLEQHGIWGH